MTDSMNFGPDWIRNLSSDGSGAGVGASGSATRYQLADYRYGREEMLALFDRNIKPPACLTNFKSLYSETTLPPLALLPSSEDEGSFQRGGWQSRPTTLSGPPRGRGGSLERGGRVSRGRGSYPSYGRPSTYEGGWGNGDSSDWSPRKEYNSRPASLDNWRRVRGNEEDDGWRNLPPNRNPHEKWGRSTSWRGEGEIEERSGPPERGNRSNWHETTRGPAKRSWDSEDHLPEWANENPSECGGSFDERGAFHGSDDEQLEGRGFRREGLQKSTSQQHITNKGHPPLHSSKSTMSLVKDEDGHGKRESGQPMDLADNDSLKDGARMKLAFPDGDGLAAKERIASEGKQKTIEVRQCINDKSPDQRIEDSEFEKLQEDFVLKLVVDEEPQHPPQTHASFDLPSLPPPPNLTVAGQDKWFYQDPQGQMQGPFTNTEMSEWFKAGYFGQDLKVRRHCDERFFLLGELMTMCGGSNPFQTTLRFPVLKNDISKMPENDLQFQYLSQLAAYKQAQARVHADPWSALTLQQQEVAAQRLIMQQQQQVQSEIPYLQQQATNPLMQMISQMQQANKLPGPGLLDKPPQNMPSSLDPHVQMHMSNFLSLQNRLPSGLPNHLPSALTGSVPTSIPPDSIHSLQNPSLTSGGMPLPGMPNPITGLGLTVPRASSVEQVGSTSAQSDPISSLLKQLQHKQQAQQVEALWQQNQFSPATSVPSQQWQPPQEVPLSLWDVQQQQQQQQPLTAGAQTVDAQLEKPALDEKEAEARPPRDDAKEQKIKKEQEEKQQKKETEEKRKQEQRRLEAEKKAEAERKRKEEEKIRKELEKAKREAEEKRLRELEERRRLKEQRKVEDEARKKAEGAKRLEEERMQKEKQQKEAEEKQRAEEKRQEQLMLAKAAPWSQSNSALGMSLTEIQKAEKERKLQEVALQQQRAQLEKEMQQQQQQHEKPSGLQLSWARKPVEPRKVKSLAEIQAEEQERLAKESAEARMKKEKEAKEAPPQVQSSANIWSGQNLTWASASTTSQWSSTNYSGFWEDAQPRVPQLHKPSGVSKSSSASTIGGAPKQPQQLKQQQQPKVKAKKEESSTKKNHNNNNGPLQDDFTAWCHKALANFSSDVDIPTFITFLRDIESAFEVREYCKEYLGESNTTQQFANNFLEKRRSFKPKNAHKDDMCSPAPAITPSTQHSMEFQEVKGKNKKNKKSKMLKVDSRILGFNVTSAPDRINVGDRDYGDNS
ncbi:GRB10-interacting GYF protein 2 isoform X2 [Cylas formicarius]|uniref:GRB10-interacting GYF protein 2 isoform X2 n=1 Tax=Cylas formicarius TaxID=197179 RepID=UPI002958A223|nr:GRB10-interacting GYF protein 2 isoform X2 [Cylas formicarius]